MKRNRFTTAFELLFGVVLGAPAAALAVYMFPNIEMMASEQSVIDSLTIYDHLRYYVAFGSQIVGYIALLIGFFANPISRVAFRNVVLFGLAIGVIASFLFSPFDVAWLLRDLQQLTWGRFTGTSLFFLVYSILLAAAGISLFLKHARFPRQQSTASTHS